MPVKGYCIAKQCGGSVMSDRCVDLSVDVSTYIR